MCIIGVLPPTNEWFKHESTQAENRVIKKSIAYRGATSWSKLPSNIIPEVAERQYIHFLEF